LTNHTNLKIGGKADIFYEAFNTQDLINTIKLAKYQSVPVTIIGWGSNILISDKGIRGIVIKNSTKTIKIKGEKPIQESKARISSRFEANKLK
jgi:UDP-N-acetylmuramate dehydrogenase